VYECEFQQFHEQKKFQTWTIKCFSVVPRTPEDFSLFTIVCFYMQIDIGKVWWGLWWSCFLV
ncbi:unnamed protein product, partial [Amoebophrya sp. A120]